MISIKQNQLCNLELQAAVNTLYNDSKFLMTMNFLVSVCIPFVLGILGIIKDYSIFIYLAVICGLSSIALASWIKKVRCSAVQMQELYDRSVFSLNWNKLFSGEKPNNNKITNLSKKYKKKHGDFSEFLDWYTLPAASYQYPLSIILCQSQNLSWDIPNREKYYKSVLAFTTVLIVIFVGVSIYYFENFLIFIKVLSASIPIVIFLVYLVIEHRETVEEGNRLNGEIEDVLSRLSNDRSTDQEIISLAEQVQTVVYSYRKSARPIPNKVHKYFKNQNEDLSVRSIQRYIDNYFK